MNARYVVLTSGRYPSDSLHVHMDVKTHRDREPMTLIEAKQRAAVIVKSEPGVRAYVAEITLEAVPPAPPDVTFRSLTP